MWSSDSGGKLERGYFAFENGNSFTGIFREYF
jgi:hypothetical protein